MQLIADFIGANLVTSDSVTGTMTLRLEDVPWDQALDLILRTEGLAKREYGNVLLIGPADELASQERTELENLRELSELKPLTTEYVRVRYANAAQMVALLGSGAGSVLSERGAALVDERTNTVVLTDTAERLAGFRAALANLDIPVRQVLIEGRIVNVNRDHSARLGIRWGGVGREVLEDGARRAIRWHGRNTKLHRGRRQGRQLGREPRGGVPCGHPRSGGARGSGTTIWIWNCLPWRRKGTPRSSPGPRW